MGSAQWPSAADLRALTGSPGDGLMPQVGPASWRHRGGGALAGHSRVLVVDDVDEMRTLIHRALGDSGYAVDVAATLTEARGMVPSGYDALLVDAHIGQERGMDLIDELRSKDPAAARRCLVMSGGPAEALPEGVGRLGKPFRLAELIDAVGERTADPAAPGGPTAQAQAQELLGLSRALRVRERQDLIDFLHDGPVQELAAAALELQLLARSMAPGQAQAVDSVLRRLDAASVSLRLLLDGQCPFAVPDPAGQTAGTDGGFGGQER
jgi:CheY-like chemotaxis protein